MSDKSNPWSAEENDLYVKLVEKYFGENGGIPIKTPPLDDERWNRLKMEFETAKIGKRTSEDRSTEQYFRKYGTLRNVGLEILNKTKKRPAKLFESKFASMISPDGQVAAASMIYGGGGGESSSGDLNPNSNFPSIQSTFDLVEFATSVHAHMRKQDEFMLFQKNIIDQQQQVIAEQQRLMEEVREFMRNGTQYILIANPQQNIQGQQEVVVEEEIIENNDDMQ